MFKDNYSVVGVMSGTSLDGIDLLCVNFSKINDRWIYDLLESDTITYSESWLTKLKTAVNFSHEALQQLNEEYTILLSTVIRDFISTHKIKNLDAVCSHGHTVLHQPQNGITLQIGNLPVIAKLLNQKVVCDFRVQDVKLGGQGAPLVPIGDKILFSEYDYCLNLGGFSNISYDDNNDRIAFDISPVNTVLNYYASKLNLDYDDKGLIAKSGIFNKQLFDQLNELEFYHQKHPKSLGFEFVKNIVIPITEKSKLSVADILRTFTEHIAIQISKAIDYKKGSILVTGGGAFNEFLIERMAFYLPELKIIIPDRKTLEFKEALIFGFLGVLKLRNEINVLRSVTGATENHSSGEIYIP
jgi:anhydro-N-acetylmuramic acid kinase